MERCSIKAMIRYPPGSLTLRLVVESWECSSLPLGTRIELHVGPNSFRGTLAGTGFAGSHPELGVRVEPTEGIEKLLETWNSHQNGWIVPVSADGDPTG